MNTYKATYGRNEKEDSNCKLRAISRDVWT